jgi:hypothetical protein
MTRQGIKTLIFQKEFNERQTYFMASGGCFESLEKLYGVRQQNIIGKSEQFLKCKAKFHCLNNCEGLPGKQTYNCDETSLTYKACCQKTVSFLG